MGVQSSYSITFNNPNPGTPGDSGLRRVESALYNGSASPDIPAGIGVVQSSEGVIDQFSAQSQKLLGVLLNDFAHDPNSLTGSNAFHPGGTVNVQTLGAIVVVSEQTVAVSDPVYCRFAAGTGTQLGAFRKDSDNGTARLVKGARWVKSGDAASNPPAIYFDNAAEHAAALSDAAETTCTLTAAAKASNAWAVTGQVTDLAGNPVSAATEVYLTTLAPTDNKGAIAVTTGTANKIVNPTTGPNVCWLTTNSSGVFVFTVTDSVAESVIVKALAGNGPEVLLKVT